MKTYPKIGTIGLILAVSIGCMQLSVFAQGNGLPKVGVVKSSLQGAGCSYALAGRKSTAPIFVSIAGEDTLMNFDGKDIKLKPIGTRSVKTNQTQSYTAKNLKITLVPRLVKKIDYSQFFDAQFTISNGKNSQTIKAQGSCGC